VVKFLVKNLLVQAATISTRRCEFLWGECWIYGFTPSASLGYLTMAIRTKRRTSGAAHRFDVAKLREVAGEKVFGRGVEYHEDGQVEIVSIDSSRVLA